jgi:hypothetical protein
LLHLLHLRLGLRLTLDDNARDRNEPTRENDFAHTRLSSSNVRAAPGEQEGWKA